MNMYYIALFDEWEGKNTLYRIQGENSFYALKSLAINHLGYTEEDFDGDTTVSAVKSRIELCPEYYISNIIGV